MPKKITHQWEFGDLFPFEISRNVMTVCELTRQIKRLLEDNFRSVWVCGEVSGLKLHTSGHIYFALKDEYAQISCVVYRGESVENREYLRDGVKVLIQGELNVYEPRGQYQLSVKRIELYGQGKLQAAFEALKRKLTEEGLFDPARKRPIPPYPRRIGIVTSLSGAAIRDIIHIFERRFCGVELVIASCRVQGEGAAAEIASSIQILNEYSSRCPSSEKIDVILVTRGGGSIEDLWAFNEECVARAVFASQIPVISAVGHEIDFTICDFTADLRAATPSAAAEILTQNYVEAIPRLQDLTLRMRNVLLDTINDEKRILEKLLPRLTRAHPSRKLNEYFQFIDEVIFRLNRCLKSSVRENAINYNGIVNRLKLIHPIVKLKERQKQFIEMNRRFNYIAKQRFEQKHSKLAEITTKLELLSPKAVLRRGFSITMDDATQRIIRSEKEIANGQVVKTVLSEGEFKSVAIKNRNL